MQHAPDFNEALKLNCFRGFSDTRFKVKLYGLADPSYPVSYACSLKDKINYLFKGHYFHRSDFVGKNDFGFVYNRNYAKPNLNKRNDRIREVIWLAPLLSF